MRNSIRLIAWSLAVIAVVLAVFLPLGYRELIKQERWMRTHTAPTAPVAEADSNPVTPIPPTPEAQPAGSPEPTDEAGRKLTTLGDFHLQRGEYDDAIESYQRGLRINPSDAALRARLNSAIESCKKEVAILHTEDKCGAP